MIIICKGADASANNIGLVEVPVIWDTDAAIYRAAIPTAAGAFNYAKNRALNNFFKGLKSAGVFSKITNLYLPILGQVEGGVNLKNPASNIGFPASGAVATYNSNGVNFLQGWQVPFTSNYLDLTVGSYNTTAAPDVDVLRVSMAFDNNNFYVGRRVVSPKAAGLLLNAGLLRPSTPNRMSGIGPLMGSSKSSIAMTSALIDTEYVPTGQNYNSGPASSNFKLGGHTANSATGNQETSYGLFFWSSYLDQTEMVALGALQTTLITALMA